MEGHSVRSYWTYILASRPRGTLYIGVTNGIIRRIEQIAPARHRASPESTIVHRLVWFQEYGKARDAIQREKTMKEWPREWKINLIERENPRWDDLYPSLPGVRMPSIPGASGLAGSRAQGPG